MDWVSTGWTYKGAEIRNTRPGWGADEFRLIVLIHPGVGSSIGESTQAPHSRQDARPIGVEIPGVGGTLIPMERASDVLTGASRGLISGSFRSKPIIIKSLKD